MVNGYIYLNILLSQKTVTSMDLQHSTAVIQRKTFYKFERKVSRTLVGSESGLQKFMKIVFLGIQSCGGQSFMFKIIHSLEYVFIDIRFKMCLLCLSSQTGHASTKSCVSPTRITPARFPSKRYVTESSIVGFCFILRGQKVTP